MNGERKRPLEELPSAKRQRLDVLDSLQKALKQGQVAEAMEKLEELCEQLRHLYCGYRSTDCKVALKRQLLQVLPHMARLAKEQKPLRHSVATYVDCIIRSGFAQTARDRRDIIASGAWLMSVEPLIVDPNQSGNEDVLSAVHVYLHLSDYVGFYDDFIGMHPEFWHPEIFRQVLKQMPRLLAHARAA